MKKFPDYSNEFGKNIIDHEINDNWSTGFYFVFHPSLVGGYIYIYAKDIFFQLWYLSNNEKLTRLLKLTKIVKTNKKLIKNK